MDKKFSTALSKELLAVEKKEQRLERSARKEKPGFWKQNLESKIPKKVLIGLESAFCTGFSMVFQKGTAVIEKSYRKEELQADHAIRDFAVERKGRRKELKQMRNSAKQSDLKNLAVTTAEGIALGVLGIGMPDIALFLGTVLKGVYETALHYGFDYDTPGEQMLILGMMQAALSHGETYTLYNARVDEMLTAVPGDITQEDISEQIRETASVFAMDMLLLKFVQGLPVIGIIGGGANPLYYRKILNYVELKYRKRYLLLKRNSL